MFKKLIRWLLQLLYKVEIEGLENFAKAGERVLIISNHVSFLDPPLLWAFLPDNVTFAINTQIAEKSWVKPFLRFTNVFEMDPTRPLSLKNLIHHLKKDNKAVIFPEGFLQGMKFAVCGQSLNGGDLRSVGLHRKHQA